ncbi:TRAP transporter small permease [Vibrio sp. S12_S33]|uniref:TRAP transporter small permease n=1 Tax=Vibrio sp. S12_S33 TaxID=2720223 RepID=UPI00178086AA|nr:TRAP transporter small permease subunit [Vibrio sp. S12_S33]MBD1567091.1 TRAP transporter small permease subunit [Vibrio sp. S12_S33]
MKFFKLVNGKILKWEENIACICLFLIVFLVFFAALLRVVGIPQSWMNDLSKLLFGWVVFLGSDLALNNGRHIGVEFFEEMLPNVYRKWIAKLWSVAIIAFLSFISYFGWFLTERSRREFDSLKLSESNIFILFGVLVVFALLFDYIQAKSKSKVTYMSLAIIAIVSLLIAYMTVDFDTTIKPISYSYLIASVPIGCLLMIRTELFCMFKNKGEPHE